MTLTLWRGLYLFESEGMSVPENRIRQGSTPFFGYYFYQTTERNNYEHLEKFSCK